MSLQSIIYGIRPSFSMSRSYVLNVGVDDTHQFFYCEPSIQNPGDDDWAPFDGCRPIAVDASEVQALWEKVGTLSIRPVPPLNIGCDGTIYDLTIENGFNRVHYTWWPELPEEWAALGEIIETITRWAA